MYVFTSCREQQEVVGIRERMQSNCMYVFTSCRGQQEVVGTRERMQSNRLYVFTSCREQQEVVRTREKMQAVWDFQTNMSVISSTIVSNPHKGWKLKAHLFLEEPMSSSAARVSQGAVPGSISRGV